MGISVNDLLDMGLKPVDFKAACYVLTRSDHDLAVIPTKDIAAILDMTERQARRVIQSLIEAGLMTRVQRGVYRIHMPEERTSVSYEGTSGDHERTPVSVLLPVSSHMTIDLVTKTPNGVLVGRSAPPKGYTTTKGNTVADGYDADDVSDLGGVGHIRSADRPSKRRSRPATPQFHRSVPRSEWDMNFVAKEFRHRLHPFVVQRNLIGAGGGKSLPAALRRWEAEYGLTPQEAATLCDDFFDDERQAARISNSVEAYRQWLQYIKENFDRVHIGDVEDADVARVASQEVPF